MTHARCVAVVGGLGCALLPSVAYAHLVSARFGDFYGGVLYPVTALEHALPLLALGLLAGLQGPPGARLMVYLTPVGLLFGMALALMFPAIDAIITVNRSSFIILGLLVALGRPLPDELLAGLTIVFTLSHGYENGLAITPDMARHLFGLGVVAAGSVGVMLVAAATLSVVPIAGGFRIAVRAAGSWIAAIGLMVIVL